MKQLNVLREISLHRPAAHLAFLVYGPYYKMYANQGQDVILAEKIGQWEHHLFYGDVIIGHKMRYNKWFYHPTLPHIHNEPRGLSYTRTLIYGAFYTQGMTFCYSDTVQRVSYNVAIWQSGVIKWRNRKWNSNATQCSREEWDEWSDYDDKMREIAYKNQGFGFVR